LADDKDYFGEDGSLEEEKVEEEEKKMPMEGGKLEGFGYFISVWKEIL
jgi:hypothetical protein